MLTTKPHLAHPNYVFLLDDEVWVTRCKQRDAVCLNRNRTPIALPTERVIHDGVVTDHGIYFTAVDGQLIHVDRDSLQVRQTYDLAKIMPGMRKPGLCRGLLVIDEQRVVVGFSRFRPTKWTANLSWLKLTELRWLHRMPARVCQFNIARQRVEWDFELQSLGMTTIFSIHAAPHVEVARRAA